MLMNNDNNGWKQPIPVNLRQEFGDDHLARLIYQELLLMACNSEQVKNVNGQIIKLERGQCYYTTLYFSKIFQTHRNSVVNALKRLNRMYNKIDNRATPKGSIATLINYDEVVKIDNRMYNKIDNRETTAGQQSDTNKSANSGKSGKRGSESSEILEDSNEEGPPPEKSWEEKGYKKQEFKKSPILEVIEKELPELSGTPILPIVVKTLNQKEAEENEKLEFIRFVARNKKDKIFEIKGWKFWFWDDFISERYKPSSNPQDKWNSEDNKDDYFYFRTRCEEAKVDVKERLIARGFDYLLPLHEFVEKNGIDWTGQY